MSLTVPVELPAEDRVELVRWTRAPSFRAGWAQRARIVLLAGDGVGINEIVTRVGVSKPTVIAWKKRYVESGISGLADLPKPGRPGKVDEVAVVLATLEPPPQKLGVTHWSSRLLAEQLGISQVWVSKIWRKWGLQPWRRETFMFSTDPQLEAKVRDVVGLYLNPPDNAVVLSIDAKSQIQALDRTAPILPLRPGLPEKATHDYVRHGTTTLFAALEVATGKVTDACYPRHRHEEFLKFLKQVAKAYPRVPLHIVADNYATHKHPSVQAWLAKNRRITMHFTPTSGSWLNMVEIFFGIITRQAIRRGSSTSVKDLITAIQIYTDAWNERCQPFTWTKTADEIIPKATGGQRTSFTRHWRLAIGPFPKMYEPFLVRDENRGRLRRGHRRPRR
jgi:transposase